MSQSFSLITEKFQGPLEALLNLIEGRKLSISEISLASVCDAYLVYIEQLPELPLAETSQFILVASTLLLIKSRSLLPTLELSQDERESVEELERRLAMLSLIRRASRILKKEWGAQPLSLAHSAPLRPTVFAPAEATVPRICAAVERIVRTLPRGERLREAAVAPVRALEDVIVEVSNRLQKAFRASFREFTKTASREEAIVYFLAMLELVRSGNASVSQERLFADITIEIEQTGIPRYG